MNGTVRSLVCVLILSSCAQQNKVEEEQNVPLEDPSRAYSILANEVEDEYPVAKRLILESIEQDSNAIACHNLLYLFALQEDWDSFCYYQSQFARWFNDEPIHSLRAGMCAEKQGYSSRARTLYQTSRNLLQINRLWLELSGVKELPDSAAWRSKLLTEIVASRMLKDSLASDSLYQKLIKGSPSQEKLIFSRQQKASREVFFEFMRPNAPLDPKQAQAE